GKQGNNLKKIGSVARLELEKLFNIDIYLNIFVKVEKDWRNKNYQLDEYGYSSKDY
ncbi:MAG: KH domain-containing protein, partial [Bacilli bacterium]|nr:KH domain-containing protein [Bacilli bacterium]